MEYRIQVTEKLQHIETVSAASGTEAVELVRQSYKEEKIVLSSEHFSDVAFAVEHQKAQAYLQIAQPRFRPCPRRLLRAAAGV